MLNLSWYYTLNQPPLTPPAWVFPPAWTILYILIFVSFVVFAITPYEIKKTKGYVLFFSQMLLNLAWTPMFFMMKNIGFALIIILVLDILVLMNIKEFWKVSKTAGKILIPYFIWLIYATYLNIGFFLLN